MPDQHDNEFELVERLAERIADEAPSLELPEEVRGRVRNRLRERVGTDAIAGAYTLRNGDGQWMPILPGVEKKILHRDSDMYLLRLIGGAVLPPHEHNRTELCLVLEGEMSFDGIHIEAGDFHVVEAGYPHPAGTTKNGAVLLISTL
jgi:mannose-6-phosphate isomerase-like protein (cupin superfamily)